MRALEFITGHVIFKLRYNQIDQLKTTYHGNFVSMRLDRVNKSKPNGINT